MKKITLLFFLLTVSLGFSQVVIEDFEGAEPELSYSAENDPATFNGSFITKANPVPEGNASDKAAELITDVAGQPWQNAQLIVQTGKEIDLTGAVKTVSVKIFSDIATPILAKVVDGPSGAGEFGSEVATDALHTGSGWETLTFDFNNAKDCQPGLYCGPAFEVYKRILFFPLWNAPGWEAPFGGPSPLRTIWVDDIVNNGVVLGVEDFQKVSFKAFPNPTQNNWTITTKNESITSIQVFDVLGKNVLSLLPSERTAVIDGANFKAGLYFAQIKTVSGLSSLKLIKK
jgi:hypothetical protein